MNIICTDYDSTKKPCTYYAGNGCCSLKTRFRCIEFIRRKAPVLSYSYISNYLRCRRNFYYSYLLGIELIIPPLPIVAGRIMSNFLAYMHSDANNNDKEKKNYLKRAKEYLESITPKDENAGAPSDVKTIPAVARAYKELGLDEPKGKVEYRTILSSAGDEYKYLLKAIYDLYLFDKIYEFKYTGKPDFYTFFTTRIQAGIYLLTAPSVKSITFRLIQKPTLKQGKNETDEEYKERVREDFKKRPAHYVKDITFWRNEYNFNEIKDYISLISDEVRQSIDKGIDYFYQNPQGCLFPGPCDFLPVCESKANPLGMTSLYKKKTADIMEEEVS